MSLQSLQETHHSLRTFEIVIGRRTKQLPLNELRHVTANRGEPNFGTAVHEIQWSHVILSLLAIDQPWPMAKQQLHNSDKVFVRYTHLYHAKRIVT